MRCAQECLALGYPDKSLGYQSFLYSNNPAELRSIFMFLVELMQAKNGQDAKENANGASAELDQINLFGNTLILLRYTLTVLFKLKSKAKT